MLDQLRFVRGAVAHKELLPAMTHFVIEKGFVRSYNGALALCAPIPFSLDCRPKAVPFIHAISMCEETIQLALTAAGKLRISSGAFKAYIDCIDDAAYHVQPEGEEINFDGQAVLDALRTLDPFIGNDASRPWSNGILLSGQSAYATNNVVAVQYWIGGEIPFEANLPKAAVVEMLRINEPPTRAQLHTNSISFHYADGRWIRSQLLDVAWPDIHGILSVSTSCIPLPLDLFESLEKIKPFTDKMGRVYIANGELRTVPKDDTETGASVKLNELAWEEGIYQIDMLSLLKGVATSADFNRYPLPSIFYGDRIRGAIIGMKM